MDEDDLTRQDEDISVEEYIADEREEPYDFGNWPELFGVLLTALLVWLTVAFTG